MPARGTLRRAVFAIVAIATAAPLLCARHLPFSDLPEHLAAIETLATYFDPAYASRQYFEIQGAFATPYLLYHVVAAALSHLVGGVENANLILLVVAAVAMVPALAQLARRLGADDRLAIMAAPLFWNRALAEGLLNFVASIPVAIWLLSRTLRATQRGVASPAVACGVIGLFYLHTSSFLLFVAGSAWFAICHVRSMPWRTLLRRQLVWVIPMACVLPVFVYCQEVSRRALGEHSGVVRYLPTKVLARLLFAWLHDLWRAPWDDCLAIALWCAVALFFALGRSAPRTTRALTWSRRGLALLGGLAYFSLPNQVSYAFILDLRMAPWLALLALLAGRRRIGVWADRVFAALAALCLTFAGATMHSLWHFERDEARHFDLVIRNLPRGKKLLTLVYFSSSQYMQVTPFLHYGAYYRARAGGIAGFSFAEVPHWPVRYREGVAPPKKATTFWDWNPCLFRNTIDGAYYDFILVRGDLNPVAHANGGPHWRVIGASRDWMLYEKTAQPWLRSASGEVVDEGPCPRDEPAP
jgi:hypothetical protein